MANSVPDELCCSAVLVQPQRSWALLCGHTGASQGIQGSSALRNSLCQRHDAPFNCGAPTGMSLDLVVC